MQPQQPTQEETYREYVTVGDAAVLLGVSIDTIRRWEKTGKLKAERFDGKNRYFAVDELEHFKSGQPLSTTEVALMLGVSPSTVRRLEQSGELQSNRDEKGHRMFKKTNVEGYARRQANAVDSVVAEAPLQIPVRRELPIAAAEVSVEPSIVEQPLMAQFATPVPTRPHLTSGPTMRSGGSGYRKKSPTLNGLAKLTENFYRSMWGRLALRAVIGFTAVVAVFVMLFFLFPSNMARVMGYRPSTPSAKHYTEPKDPNLFAKAVQPFATSALGIVEVINPELRERIKPHDTIKNVNDIFGADAEGNINSKYTLTVPDSSYIKIPDNGLISNLNAEYLNGRKPGEGSGNLAVLPLNGKLIRDNSITGAQIADGSIQLGDLSPSLLSSLRSGSGGSGATGATGPAGPQGIQGPTGPQGPPGSGGSGSGDIEEVVAGLGLQGGGTSGTVTLSVSTGDSLQVVSGDVEVRLATSGSSTITTSSNSGLEITNQGLRMIGGCTVGQILKWNGAAWGCSADSGGSGGGSIDVQTSDGSSVVSGASNIAFGPLTNSTDEFTVTSAGGGQARIQLGSNVLQTGNYAAVLDPNYVNLTETPVAGDITGSFNGGFAITADAVALGNDTVGSYVAGLSSGTGLTVTGSGSENASVLIALDVTTTSTTGTISSNSGLEIGADGLRLIGGCSTNQILKWNGSVWACGADNTGAGALDVKEGGTTVTAAATALNFAGSDFGVVNVAGQADISLDYVNSGITRRTTTEVVTGNWTFTDNVFSIQDNADNSKKVAFELAAITGGVTRTLSIPNVNGTLITSGNLTDINTVGTITSGVWQGSTLAVQYGGTGTTTFTTNGIVYGNGTGALQSTGAGTNGQIIVAGATGIPVFVSMTGDATIAANGVLTLGNSGVASGSYGSATQVPVITVDSKGRLTSVVNTTISGVTPGGSASGDLGGTYPGPNVVRINGVSLGDTSASAGNLLVASGTSWVSRAISGDLTVNSTGVATIGADAVTLGTDTNGNYVATLTGSTGLIVTGSGSESAGVSVSLDVTTTGVTGTISANSGLEIGADGLRLIGGCSNGQVLKWNSVSSLWECATDANAGSLSVQENDTTISGAATTFDFLGDDFNITESPAGEANVAIDYLNSNITRRTATETVSGSWTFNDMSFTLQDTADSSKKAYFELSAIAAGTVRALNIPNVSGTIITTGNLTDINQLGTITAGTWQGSTVSVPYGGTGQTTFTSNGVIFGNGIGGLQVTAAGTTGQLLLANASGVPTFSSLSGDVTINGTGVTAISVDAVALGADTVGSYILALGSLTGLSTTGNSGEGSTPTLSVLYGSTASTAVQGNTQVTCASGSGNLTGGGTIITLGAGGTCGAISTVNNPTFTTSVTTPLVTASGVIQIATQATAGSDDIIFDTAGTEKLRILENGNLLFEKGTDDVTIAIATPSGAPATYTFSGVSGTVLTSSNFNSSLDSSYVNIGESPAAGDIAGSFSGGLNVAANSVALATDTTGDFIASLGTLTGLLVTGNSGESSTPALNVVYGSTANTAVQGNTQLSVTAGTNLSGGGTITLGSGGTVTLNTVANPSFGTSVTSPLFTNAGALTISTTGAGNDLTLNSADQIILNGFNCSTFNNGGVLTVNASGVISCDHDDGGAAGSITGAGTANRIPLYTGSSSIGDSWLLQNGSTLQLDNTRNLELVGGNLTLTSGNADISGTLTAGTADAFQVASNGNVTAGTFNGQTISTSANFTGTLTVATGLTVSAGGLNVTNSGISNAGAISGVTSLTLNGAISGGTTYSGSGNINTTGGSLQTNSTTRIDNSGSLQNVTANTNILTSGTLGAARGGTGVDGSAATNGTLLIGNGAGFSLAALSQGSGITITNGVGTVTIAATLGTSISNGEIDADAVALGTQTTGSYVSALGALTGLSTTGNSGEGSNPTLSVLYGSTANTAVQGNTTITCASGTGNLSGGGTNITLGAGGTCGNISISDAPTFATSVTTPLLQNGGFLMVGTTATLGADDIIFQTAGTEKIRILENGNFFFEKGTNDATIAVATPSGADATYTFSGVSGTVLTSGNFNTTLDSSYVNVGELPAAGDVGGSFSGGLNIGADAVTLGTDTTGGYVSALGSLTGMSTTGNSGEGSTPTLSVLYGSTANTAVQGNTAITCASGTGNLSGGGNTITLGSGGSCGAITTNNAVSFSTSVTTPLLTTAGVLEISTGATAGSDDIIFSTAGTEKIRVLENGNLFFEKGANDATISISAPSGADAIYTFSGVSGTVMTTGNYTATLDAVYVNTGEAPAVGDITGSFSGGLNVAANSVALATDTTGDFIALISGSTGLTVSGSGGENASVSLALDVTTTSSTITTSSNSGLEIGADGLRLIGGCSNSQILKWNGSAWACAADNGTGSAPTLQEIYDNDVDGSNAVITLSSTDGGLRVRDAATPIAINLFSVQNNDASTNYFAVSTSGASITGTTTVSSDINTTGGTLQTNSTTRIDNSGNLTNIGNLTASSAFTISNTGAGNDITVNSIDQVILNAGSTIELLDNVNLTGNGDISGTLAVGTADAFQVASNGNVTGGTYNGQTISSTASFTGTVAVAGLATLNGGLTVEAGDTFTFNGDAFTDLTGSGLVLASGALGVQYGAAANTAVQGNTTITCAGGSGNLTGGGNTITLGTGGTCNAITTNNAVSFSTSVTTPLLTASGVLEISTGATAGSDDIILATAGTEKIRILENGNLFFEKGANDAVIAIAAPSGADATYTFSGVSGTILTTGNYSGSLDSVYVNVGEAPAAGDITGSFSGGLNVAANAVALGTDTTGDYVAALGTLTGLSTTGNSGEGSNPTLSVLYGSAANTAVQGNTQVTVTAGNGLGGGGTVTLGSGGTVSLNVAYGSTANTAVQGNTQITCAAGTGNLSGGGTTITLGSGGTCGNISISNAPTFTTSVTSPLFTNAGPLTLSATGATNDLTITSGSGVVNLTATTVRTTNDLTLDLNTTTNRVVVITNSGTGVTHLNVEEGSLQTAGTTRIANDGSLQNVTASTSILTSGTLGAARGGTGVDGSAAANGTLLIGNGTGYTLSTLTQGTGINITNGAGSVTVAATLGTSISNSEIDADAVTLGTQTTGNYIATLGTLTGLSTTGNTGESSTPTLSVLYGSTANTAVQGNTQITVTAGTGLGGGGTITLGGGGTVSLNVAYGSSVGTAAEGNTALSFTGSGNLTGTVSGTAGGGLTSNSLNTVMNPSFTTSVTTPLLTNSGVLTIQAQATVGSDDIVLQTAGAETVRFLENGDVKFEKGANDVTFSIATPSGSAATYTFSGASGTVLTSANFSGSLDSTYVNIGESPAAGDITGSFSGGLNVAANSVALGTDTTGDYIASLGTLTGLSTTGNSGEGSNPTLSVLYGSTANTAVQGNTQVTVSAGNGLSGGGTVTLGSGGSVSLAVAYGSAANTAVQGNTTITCASGTGNLSGGGGTITLGSGGSCGNISISDAPTFATSVTTPLLTNAGALTVSTTGANDLTLTSGSGVLNLNAGTLRRGAAGTTTIDLLDAAGTTTFSILNSNGTQVANLSVEGGVSANTITSTGNINSTSGTIQTNGTTRIANDGSLSNVTANTNILTSGTLGAARGGTGVDGSAAANGTLLIGNGSGYTLAALTQGAGIAITNGAGSITIAATLGTSISNGEIDADAVTLGTQTTGNYVSTLGTLTGLSTTGNTGEGSTPTLSVLYGSTANTAVQGNTTITCASGTGNLSGGGGTITLGAGGNCGNISITDAPTFATSVMTPALTNVGTLTVSTTGANDLTLTSGSGILNVNASTIRRSAGGTTTLDLLDAAGATTLSITNSNGSQVANLTVEGSVTATSFNGSLSGNATTASALAANPTDCAANQFATTIAANGNLTCASITDADVPDTITINNATNATNATNLIGSGSTTNAVDLATAEVAGNLRATNLQNAAADLGAANVSIDLSNTNGSFVTNLTVDGTITAATFVGALTGNATTASALAANPTDCAANQFANAIAANGNLTCASITDADVSDTLTASIFIGSGSTSNAIDLATAEVAGNLRASNLQIAAADLGAADVNLNFSNTNGAFVTNLTLDGTITAATFSGSLSGNATTASALAANPTDCAFNQFATTIAANGNLTCASITDADVPDSITINNATTAANLVGSGSTTNAVDLATAEVAGNLRATNLQNAGADLGAANITIDLSNTNGSFVTNLTIDGTITAATFAGALSGNATTASALAADPTDCAANQFANAIAANGNLTCASITDADVPNNITIDLATTATILQNAGAVTISATTTAGADDIIFSTAGSEKWRIMESGTLQAAASRTIDLSNTSATNLTLTNSGTGVLGISVEGGATFGDAITVSAGGASITGGINNNSGGITNAGAISGATNITLNGTISGGTSYTGSGNINTTAGTFQLNGVDINAAGTLTNVAYENQANNFTAGNTFSAAGTGVDITNNLLVGGTYNTNTFTSTALTFAGGVSTISTGSANAGLNINPNGTGTLSLGNTGLANTIQIGNTTGAVAQTINIGNNATASSATSLIMGSVIGTSTTTLQSGSGGIIIPSSLAGAADTATYLCRNSSNQLTTCATAGSAAAFLQGGNTVTANTDLGLNANFDLNFRTNSTTRMTVQADGDLAVNTDTLFVDVTGGEVGIGTTNPGAKLEVSSTQTSGTLLKVGVPSATTLAGTLVGQLIDLSTNVTATNQSVTGLDIRLPVNSLANNDTFTGINVQGGAFTGDGLPALWQGVKVTIPSMGNWNVDPTAHGIHIQNGAMSDGIQNLLNLTANAVGINGGTVRGINISEVSPNANLSVGINLTGVNWDYAALFQSGNVGIGDLTPDYKLEVQNAAGSGYLAISNASDGDILAINNSGDAVFGRNLMIKGPRPWADVRAYGATGDGATDDTTAIQAAIDAVNAAGGGEVRFPQGTYITTTLTTYSKVHLRGSGIDATTIKLKDNSDVDLIKGENFDALTGTNSTSGIYNWSIQDLTLDGNKANNATNGYGLRVYGYGYIINDVRIRNTRQDGFYTEWSNSAATPGNDSMEAHVSGLKVHSSAANGIVWHGPHDSTMINVQVYENAGRGVWVKPNGNALVMTGVHSWGSSQTYSFYIESTGVIFNGSEGEGASTAQVMIGANDVQIFGGQYFAAGSSGPCIQIGDGTHTNIAGTDIDTKLINCTGGAIQFNSDAGSSRVKALVYQTNNNIITGTPNTASTQLEISASGVASVAGSGTGGGTAYSFIGGAGGATTSTTGQAGGDGSVIKIQGGTGGDAPSGSANGNGGLVTIQGGLPGGGAGTTGAFGAISLQSSGGTVGIGGVDASRKLNVAGVLTGTVAGDYTSGILSVVTRNYTGVGGRHHALFGRADVGASITVSSTVGLGIASPVKGAGSTINDNFGVLVDSQSAGGTSNYGVHVAGASGGSSMNTGLRVTGVSSAATNYGLYIDAAAQNYFAGNVGIGTTAPDSSLHINKSSAAELRLTSDASWPLIMKQTNTSDFSITNGGVERLVIQSGGNVGIGDTTPAATLTVGNGDLFQVAGASGNITTSGTYNTNTFTGSALTFGAASAATIQSASNQNLTVQSQGSGDLTLTAASGLLNINTSTLRRSAAGTTTIDLLDATGATTLNISNSNGSQVANLTVEGGATFGAALTVSAGGASISGGLNNNSGGITNTGAVAGATTITASSTINTTGGTIQTNSTDRIDNSGNLTNIGTIAAAGGDFNVNTFGDLTSVFTALDGSTTTNGTAVVPSTSMVLTSATNFDVGNYIRLSSTDCSGTEDICYAKITGKVTNTLTITPALVWANGSAVAEYHVPEVGGTNTAEPLANRYGRGYFISGVVTGNGTTYYEENGITSSLTSFSLLNSTVTTLNIGGAATTVNLGVSGGTVNIAGGLSVAQAISGVGVNAGSGLLQGTGGLTVTGTANINTTGTAATTIGNATGTVSITGSATSTIVLGGSTLSATEINLLDGRNGAIVDTDDAVATAITGTGVLGAGSIGTGFGAIDVGADSITTTGTIGTAGTTTFTGAGATFSGTLAANGSITSTQATLTVNAGGAVDVQDALTTDSLTTDTGGVSIAAGQSYTGAGAVTLSSAAGTVLTIDSGTTGAINIGTSANAKTITLGNTTGATAVTLQAGTGGLNITTQGTGALNIANNAVAQTINIGNGTGATAVSVLCGTGACGFGNNAVAHTTTVGSTTGTAATTLQAGTGGLSITTQGTGTLGLGNNAVAQTIVVGNTTTTTSLTLQAGSGNIILGSGTVQRTAAGTTTFNLIDGSNTTFAFTNTGAGNANVTADGTITASGRINGVVGFQFNGTNGTTVSCASNQFLGTQVTQGGIITSGTCETDDTGISDSILKTDVALHGSVLNQIKNLNIYDYRYRCEDAATLGITLSCESRTGVMAQELAALFPELVYTRSDGYLGFKEKSLMYYGLQTTVEMADMLDGDGDVNFASISTGGIVRLNSNGALQNITTISTSGNITTGGSFVGNGNVGSTIVQCGNNQYIGSGIRVDDGLITSGSCRNDGVSDQRLKTNVASLENGVLNNLKAVNAVSFDFRCEDVQFANAGMDCFSGRQTGVIAQELAAVFPELVFRDENGYYNVKYQGLSIYTLKAVQELSAIVDELMLLKGQVTDLEGRVASLEANPGVTNENGEPVYIENLTVGRMTINMDLFTRGAITVAGNANFQAEVFFQELVTFGNSAVFTRDVQFQDGVSFSNNTGGYAIMNPGQQTIRVNFTKPFAQVPIVSISLTDGKFAQYSYKNVTAEGFDIVLSLPATEQLQFSWIALSVNNPNTVSQP